MAKRNQVEETEVDNEAEVSDYGDILDTVWDDIPEDKLLPTGSWLLGGRNASYVGPKVNDDGSKTNGKVLFFYVPKEPVEGVDLSEIEDLGPDYDVTENQVVYTSWIEFNRDWDKVRKHLALHGLTDGTQSIRAALKAFKGTEVIAHVDVRTYKNRNNETVTENAATNFRAVEA